MRTKEIFLRKRLIATAKVSAVISVLLRLKMED